jgi:putative DNA primase/helicase
MSHKHRHRRRDRQTRQAKARISTSLRSALVFHTASAPDFALSAPPTIGLVRAEDVAPKLPFYLWPPAIAFGKVSVILATTTACTSALTAELAAKASVGGELPQTQGPVPITGTAIIASEVTVAERIRPELDAAGADLSRVHFLVDIGGKIGGLKAFEPIVDTKAVISAIQTVGGIKLGLVELTIPRIDVDIAQNYKGLFASFYTIAHELDSAITLLFHPADHLTTQKQIARAANAVASLQSISAVGFITREKATGRWVLVWTKNVVGHDAPGIAFRIESSITNSVGPAAVIAWDPEPVAATETAKLLGIGGDANAMPSKLQRAKDFLADQLSAGLVEVTKLETRALAVGISKAALTRARKELGIEVGSKSRLSALKRAKDFLLAELANGSLSAKSIQRKADAARISKASLRRAAEALKIRKKRKGGIKGRWMWRLPSTS